VRFKVDEWKDSDYNTPMEFKAEKTKETSSILSLPPRAAAVWLLGKLSLLLGVVLLALPALFALELMAEARRVGRHLDPVTTESSSMPLAGSLRSGTRATPTALSESSTTPRPALPESVVSRRTGPLTAGSLSDALQVQDTATPPVTVTWVSAAQETAAAPLGEIRPGPTRTPVPTPTSAPDPEAMPVQIRIPAIKVKRSVIELPQIRDPRTGAWTQDLDVLFRKGRKDLVGHYEQSALPGQPGNTILVGHNYGYGTKGVFLKLGRLKQGNKIQVVNAAGKTYTYRVKSVQKVPWRSKGAEELLQHARLLALSGDERLTLVTCGGANIQPFPVRIYVVAEPVRD